MLLSTTKDSLLACKVCISCHLFCRPLSGTRQESHLLLSFILQEIFLSSGCHVHAFPAAGLFFFPFILFFSFVHSLLYSPAGAHTHDNDDNAGPKWGRTDEQARQVRPLPFCNRATREVMTSLPRNTTMCQTLWQQATGAHPAHALPSP